MKAKTGVLQTKSKNVSRHQKLEEAKNGFSLKLPGDIWPC